MTGLRLAVAIAFFAASAAAQSGSTTTTGTLYVTATKVKEPTAFIVHYETTEKCYECGFRYAIGCTGGQSDCGVPDKQVPHFEEFPDLKAALQFINVRPSSPGLRMWSVKPVELAKHETAKEEPQPPKVTVEVKWSVKGTQ